MSDHQDSVELKKRISKLSDQELLKMVNEDYEDYRDEALDYAEAELQARGILPDIEEPLQEEANEDMGQERTRAGRDMTCDDCGGALTPAQLFGESEIIVYLIEKKADRFLRVTACTQCGQVRLSVDFVTDIAG